MRRVRRVRGVWWALGVGVLCAVATACGSHDGSPNGAAQETYALTIQQDQRSLDKGLLEYTDLGTLHPGADVDFDVIVKDLGKNPPWLAHPAGYGPPTAPPGYVASPENVPTGGDLAVSVSCGHIRCQELSAARQSISGKGQQATWGFTVTADQVGAAHIRVTAAMYRTDSGDVLVEAAPIDITVRVERTWSYTASQVFHWLFGTAPGLGTFSGGAVATALGGFGGRLWKRIRRSPVERVLSGIPRSERADILLFHLAHSAKIPVRQAVRIQVNDVRFDRRRVFVEVSTASRGRDSVPVTDRRVVRLLRREIAANPHEGALFSVAGRPMSYSLAQEHWRRHCARVAAEIPLTSLGA